MLVSGPEFWVSFFFVECFIFTHFLLSPERAKDKLVKNKTVFSISATNINVVSKHFISPISKSEMIASRVLSYTSPAACRAFTATAGVAAGTFKLPDLPYDYAALEPVISGKIMELHHGKHHNAYVTNLNIQVILSFILLVYIYLISIF